MNAKLKNAAAIAPQPNPSATVGKFLARKPQLFINNEWLEARSGTCCRRSAKPCCASSPI